MGSKQEITQPLNFVIDNNVLKGAVKNINVQTKTIGKSLLKIFSDNPNHVGQIEAETGKQTRYSEMRENSIRCAQWLQKQGINHEDVVTICTPNQLDAYIPCIATFLVGAVYNPWHHETTLPMARHLINLTRPKFIFACENSIKILKEAAILERLHDVHFVVFGKYVNFVSLRDIMRLQSNKEVLEFEPRLIENPDTPAMILFSSGTTGMPKGVTHSYQTLFTNLENFKLLSIKNCVSLWYSSLYWISGTLCMLQTILACATRVVHANFDPEETCKVIEKYNVNWFFIPPSLITYWCKSNVLSKYKMQSLKSLMTGGAKLSKEIIVSLKRDLQPHVQFSQGYGMTEIGGIASIQSQSCQSIESVGFVAPNMQIKIIDIDTAEILGPNQQGELCIKTPTVMIGYYKNAAATKEAIDEQGWIHTGDKAYFSNLGEIFIVDRLKEVMKFRGHHVSPSEIEQVLNAHDGVIEAAVVPVPHELDLERPMAFVKKVPGSKVTEEELIQLSSTLGETKKLWGGVVFVDELPYTASGKLSRKDLKEMAKRCIVN
ncbi:4-coumarate--CoA ligase 1-like [Trichogramma pretiosum]|uniref:4-coumarate--CoA ligase 1-like n=1 Tax=Trichogramma pretiosum TaxID=7493 RepID=UPI0006C99161|nr:4-coumarate--CoA ligase 1-like [Trichogramma pretiosum]